MRAQFNHLRVWMPAHGIFQREEDYILSTNAMKSGEGRALGNEEASKILEQETILAGYWGSWALEGGIPTGKH